MILRIFSHWLSHGIGLGIILRLLERSNCTGLRSLHHILSWIIQFPHESIHFMWVLLHNSLVKSKSLRITCCCFRPITLISIQPPRDTWLNSLSWTFPRYIETLFNYMLSVISSSIPFDPTESSQHHIMTLFIYSWISWMNLIVITRSRCQFHGDCCTFLPHA
jgi:hypothetical protein